MSRVGMALVELLILGVPIQEPEEQVEQLRDPQDYQFGLCDDCGGDGYTIYVGAPGYFDTAFGNYLPTEREDKCDTCAGTGEAPECPRCKATMGELNHEYGPYCRECKRHVCEMPREEVILS